MLTMIGARLVLLGSPFEALAPALAEHGIPCRLLDDLDGEPVTPTADAAGEDDTALLQLTSGSTAEPKAVRITHRNLHANIAAMVQAARLDTDRDVMVSWLPLFHDMGMVGFLTVPMAVGIELVSVTPTDFLGRPLLWAELISRYGGTVTAAPNFAYAVLARQLGRADDGSLDLSTLRFALNGAEPIDPAAVTAFTTAGARFGLRPEAVVCAYGMAETALGVSFAPIDTGLQVDEIDAVALEEHRRAVPAGDGPARRFPLLGPPLPGIEVRVVGDDGAVLGEREVGVLQLRGDSVTPGYLTVAGPVRHAGRRRLARHRRRGLPRRRRRRGLRPPQGRDHHGRPQHLPDRHRACGVGRGRGARGQRRRGAAGGRRRPAPRVVPRGGGVAAGHGAGGGAGDREGRDVAGGVRGGGAAGRGRGAAAGQPAQDPVGEAAPRGDPRPAGRPQLSEAAFAPSGRPLYRANAAFGRSDLPNAAFAR